MTGRVDGKVALITGGGARAGTQPCRVRLAAEGADIIAVDICATFDRVPWPRVRRPRTSPRPPTWSRTSGGRIVTAEVDVRDFNALKAAVDSGVEQLGRLDIIAANAGIGTTGVKLDRMDGGPLAGDDRRQPQRGVEDGESRCAPHAGRRPGRLDHPDQLGRRGRRPTRSHRALRRGQTRRGRPDAQLRRRTGPPFDPGELRASDPRQQPDVDERERPTACSGPDLANPGPDDLAPDLPDLPHAADPVGHTRGHQQCGPVPGLGRRPATSPGSRCPSTPAACSEP